MTASLDQNADGLRSMPPLLITESQDQFASLCEELEQEIQPKGVIERTYVHDIASIICEIQRFRRFQTVIINSSRFAALQNILKQLLCCPPDSDVSDVIEFRAHGAEDLARSWFDKNKKAQTRVAKLLRTFQMDEAAIEAEAFRLCAEDVERLDRILTGLEFRRDKALRSIAEYRQILSRQLRQAADRILENDEVPRLVSRQAT
jgi:hypothetical protein